MQTVHQKWTSCILGDGSESKVCGVYALSSSYYCRTERERETKTVGALVCYRYGLRFLCSFYRHVGVEISQRNVRQTTLLSMNSTWIFLVEHCAIVARRRKARQLTLCYISRRSSCLFLTENLSWYLRDTSPLCSDQKKCWFSIQSYVTLLKFQGTYFRLIYRPLTDLNIRTCERICTTGHIRTSTSKSTIGLIRIYERNCTIGHLGTCEKIYHTYKKMWKKLCSPSYKNMWKKLYSHSYKNMWKKLYNRPSRNMWKSIQYI
jgi:hypothetical protein